MRTLELAFNLVGGVFAAMIILWVAGHMVGILG